MAYHAYTYYLYLYFAHLICRSCVHISLAPHVTWNLHLSFALHTDLSHAAFICNPQCRLLFESRVSTSRPQSLFASLMYTSQLCLSCAALSCTSQLGLSFAPIFYYLSHAACMCTSHSNLSFAILGRPSQLRLSSALAMCTSHQHLICTSQSHLSRAARFCTSQLLVGTYHLHI